MLETGLGSLLDVMSSEMEDTGIFFFFCLRRPVCMLKQSHSFKRLIYVCRTPPNFPSLDFADHGASPKKPSFPPPPPPFGYTCLMKDTVGFESLSFFILLLLFGPTLGCGFI